MDVLVHKEPIDHHVYFVNAQEPLRPKSHTKNICHFKRTLSNSSYDPEPKSQTIYVLRDILLFVCSYRTIQKNLRCGKDYVIKMCLYWSV